MIMAKTLISTVTLAAVLAWCAAARAQDKPPAKDDALDSLLEKLDKPKEEAKPDDSKPAKPADVPRPDAKPSAEPGKPGGDVAPKDKDLDSLLEKLGTTDDRPSPDDKPQGGGGGKPEPKPDATPGGKPDKKPDPNELTGKSRDLDEHLEELTGKRRKKKGQEGDEGGPLSDVIKQMREVEERLGKPDTGEETRKKQTQIVKQIETLIEQMRSSSGQSQGKMKKSLAMKPGKQPGGQPGETPGNTGGNAPFTRPAKPTDRRSLAGGKDAWGHLPPELRQEMDNVSGEEALPSRKELIERYYLSVSKNSTRSRGE